MARTRRKISELIIEAHPDNYTGPQWLTYVEYITKTQLVIVDVLEKNYMWGYNFDDMNDIEQQVFAATLDEYWNATLYGEPVRIRIPVHEWLYDRGMGGVFGCKLVGYNINDILRVVGPVRYEDPDCEKMQVRRRKRVLIKRDQVK